MGDYGVRSTERDDREAGVSKYVCPKMCIEEKRRRAGEKVRGARSPGHDGTLQGRIPGSGIMMQLQFGRGTGTKYQPSAEARSD